MTLRATLTTRMEIDYQGPNSFDDQLKSTIEKVLNLVDGTDANKTDEAYIAERTVASATNDDIDLAGSLENVFGETITFAEIVGIIVINQQKDGTANTTALTIGAGSNPFVGFLGGTTPTIGPIQPGGAFMLFSGHASGIGTVTATSADILRIANASGASNTYQIAIIGRTA